MTAVSRPFWHGSGTFRRDDTIWADPGLCAAKVPPRERRLNHEFEEAGTSSLGGPTGGPPRPGGAGRSSAPHRKTQSRSAKVWRAASANPLVVAVAAAVVSAVISVPTTLLIANQLDQGSANAATVQAQQDAAAAALSHDAELVGFGLATAPHSGSPQIVIENRSSGWIRNMTLVIPVPVRKTTEADGSVTFSIPNFGTYSGGGNGFQGVDMTAKGATFREPLLDIGPCQLAVTTALRSFPALDPATLAKSELDFTDPNGHAWTRFGSGKLVRNIKNEGPSVWSPYAILEPLPGCSTG